MAPASFQSLSRGVSDELDRTQRGRGPEREEPRRRPRRGGGGGAVDPAGGGRRRRGPCGDVPGEREREREREKAKVRKLGIERE